MKKENELNNPFLDSLLGKSTSQPTTQQPAQSQNPFMDGLSSLPSVKVDIPQSTPRPTFPSAQQTNPVADGIRRGIEKHRTDRAQQPVASPMIPQQQVEQAGIFGRLKDSWQGTQAQIEDIRHGQAQTAMAERVPIHDTALQRFGLSVNAARDARTGETILELSGQPDKELIRFIPGQWDPERGTWVVRNFWDHQNNREVPIGSEEGSMSPYEFADVIAGRMESNQAKPGLVQKAGYLADRFSSQILPALSLQPEKSPYRGTAETFGEKAIDTVSGIAGRSFTPLPGMGGTTFFGAMSGTVGKEAAMRATPAIMSRLPEISNIVAERLLTAGISGGASASATLAANRTFLEFINAPLAQDEWENIPEHLKGAAKGIVKDAAVGFIIGAVLGVGVQGVRELRLAQSLKGYKEIGHDIKGKDGKSLRTGIYYKYGPVKSVKDLNVNDEVRLADGRSAVVEKINSNGTATVSISSPQAGKAWAKPADGVNYTPEEIAKHKAAGAVTQQTVKPVDLRQESFYAEPLTAANARARLTIMTMHGKDYAESVQNHLVPYGQAGENVLRMAAGEKPLPYSTPSAGRLDTTPAITKPHLENVQHRIDQGIESPKPGELKGLGMGYEKSGIIQQQPIAQGTSLSVKGALPEHVGSIPGAVRALHPSEFRGPAKSGSDWPQILQQRQEGGENVDSQMKDWLVSNTLSMARRGVAPNVFEGMSIDSMTLKDVADVMSSSPEHKYLVDALGANVGADTPQEIVAPAPIDAPGIAAAVGSLPQQPPIIPTSEAQESPVKPNIVFREIRDNEGNVLGVESETYDGTKEGAVKAAAVIIDRLDAKYPEWSNVNSRIGATDDAGNPKYTISPNLRSVSDVNIETDAAKYTWGDITAEHPAQQIAQVEPQAETSLETEIDAEAPKEPWKMSKDEYDKFHNIDETEPVNFHGTSVDAIRSIMQEGFKDFGSGANITQDFDTAKNYADALTEDNMVPSSVIKVRLKKGAVPRGEYGTLDEDSFNVEDVVLDHEEYVKQAILRNEPVPPEVLNDYPDLKELTSQEPIDNVAGLKPDVKATPKKEPTGVTATKLPKLGRKGNAGLKKWAANEYVNADLQSGDQYSRDFVDFFTKWYNAGVEGLRTIDVPQNELDFNFPPFLQTAAYDLGKADFPEGRKEVSAQTKPDTAISGVTVEKIKHTKTGADLWVVKVDGRVDGDTFKKIKSKAQSLGGYYSRFSKGFIFKSEPSQDKISQLSSLVSKTSPEATESPVRGERLSTADTLRKLWNEAEGESHGQKRSKFMAAVSKTDIPVEEAQAWVRSPDNVLQKSVAKQEEKGDTKGTKTSVEAKEDDDRDKPEVSTGGKRGQGSSETLEGAPAKDVPPVKAGGGSGASGIRGPRANQGSSSGEVKPGDELPPGVGGNQGTVDLPPEREGTAAPGGKPEGLGDSREPRGISGQNYRITQAEGIEARSTKVKTKDNIEAIRVMKKLLGESRPATAIEQEALVKYVGWGFNKKMFDPQKRGEDDGYNALRAELKEILTPKEWETARASSQFAHYTATPVINSMYKALEQMGFKGGKVLEPAMGIGHFFGMMPEQMLGRSWITGVEIESITGNIAKLLYPRGNINVMGYQDFSVPYDKTKLLQENHYDLVISNVPFNSQRPFVDQRYDHIKGANNLHNYFFVKGIDQVRPGGFLAFITSRYTMDAKDMNAKNFRKHMADKADFLGAVRLHNETFKGIAETSVVTDVIFMQKREPGAVMRGEEWIDTVRVTDIPGLDNEWSAPDINEYFINHPEMIMGDPLIAKHGMYGQQEYTVKPTDATKNIEKVLSEAFKKALPKNVFREPEKHKATEAATVEELLPADPGSFPGSFTIKNGTLMVSKVTESGSLVMVSALKELGMAADGLPYKRTVGMIGLRDTLMKLSRLELTDANEKEIKTARAELNKSYDAFVKKHGYVTDAANARAFGLDPGYYRLAALENVTELSGRDAEEAFMSLSAPWKSKKALAAPAARKPKERLAERRQAKAPAEAQKQGEVTKQQIINAINRAFHLPIRLNKFHGRERAAIYKTDKQIMRIRSQYARSLRHITHELGHHLDKLYKLADDRFTIELTEIPYVRQLMEAKPDTDEKTAIKEGIAEFINMYLMSPEDAANLTPTFLDHFEERLLDHPDVQDKLLDLRQMIDVYTNQSDIEAHLDEFIGGEKPKHDKWSTANAQERTANWWDKFKTAKSKAYTAIVDRHNPVLEAAEAITGDQNNPAFQKVWDTLRTSSSAGRAQQLIEEGQYVETVDDEGKPTGYIEKVGPSLKEIWGTVAALGKSRSEGFEMVSLFNKYIVSKHAIESEEQGIVSGALDADRGITVEHLEAFVKKIEGGEYATVFKKQLQEVLGYRNFVFDLLVAKDEVSHGHYSEADKEVILGKWKYAIPFKRIFPEAKSRGRGGSHSSPAKRYKGADLPIVNPLESLMRETMFHNKLALENEAAVTFFKLSEQFPKEAGQFWDDSIPLPQSITKTSLHHVIKQAIDKGMDPDFDIGTMDNLSIELYKGIHVTQPGKHIAILWIGGKPKAFEIFDKELFDSITGLNAEQSVFAGKIASKLAAPFRTSHIVNLAFPWRNVHRDTSIAAAHSESGFIPYISFFDGILSSIAGPAHKVFAKFTKQYDVDEKNFVGSFLQQQDEYKQLWLFYGGTMSSPDIFNDRAAEKMLESAMQKEAKKAITGWMNPLNPLGAIATGSEMGTNIGETKRAYSKGVTGRAAVARGRDLTVDHNVYGSKMKLPRQVVPFLGSFIQGGAKMHRQIKNPKTRWKTLMKYAIYISIPTLINYLLVRENPYYQEMGQIRKDGFMHIPIGNPKTTSTFMPIPRAHNLPGWVFGAMVERAIAYVDKHDPAAFKDWQESFKGNFTPPMTIWPLELSYELASNFNHFGGYPIENMSDLNRPKEERYGPHTTETAKAIGRAFGISPKKVDFSIGKVTGALGRPVVAGADKLLELANLTDGIPKAEKGLASKPIIGDYFTTVRASGTNSVDRFYADLEKATQLNNSERGPQNRIEKQYIDALPALRQVSYDLSDLRKAERAVHKARTWGDLAEYANPAGRMSTPITPEEKRKAIEYLQLKQINAVRVAYGKEPIAH